MCVTYTCIDVLIHTFISHWEHHHCRWAAAAVSALMLVCVSGSLAMCVARYVFLSTALEFISNGVEAHFYYSFVWMKYSLMEQSYRDFKHMLREKKTVEQRTQRWLASERKMWTNISCSRLRMSWFFYLFFLFPFSSPSSSSSVSSFFYGFFYSNEITVLSAHYFYICIYINENNSLAPSVLYIMNICYEFRMSNWTVLL